MDLYKLAKRVVKEKRCKTCLIEVERQVLIVSYNLYGEDSKLVRYFNFYFYEDGDILSEYPNETSIFLERTNLEQIIQEFEEEK